MNLWLILGLVAVGLAIFGKVRRKDAFLVGGIALIVVGMVPALGGQISSFTAALTDATTGGGASTSTTGASTGAFSGVPIGTLNVIAQEKGSNSYSTVDGLYKIYDAAQNPKDPNANPIASIAILNGVGSSTSGAIRTDTPYRVVVVNDSTNKVWYSEDLGVTTVCPKEKYQTQSDKCTAFVEGGHAMALVGTIDDALNENTNNSANIMSGNATSTGGCNQTEGGVYGVWANGTDTIFYNRNVLSGTWSFDYLFSASGGANRVLRNPTLQFQFDASNPPAGDEVSACSISLLSGQNLNLPSDCLGAWKNQAKIAVNNGADLNAGTLARYRVSLTQVEANMADTEKWSLNFADLGERNGQDSGLATGATDEVETIGSCAGFS